MVRAIAIALLLSISVPARAEVDRALAVASARTGVPEPLLRAVAWVESRHNPRAVSRVGAKGLMQLMPVVLQRYGVRKPFDARQNALAGAQFLRWNRKSFGSWPRALAAYNWGPGNVRRTARPGWPGSVRRYVDKVMRRWM